MSVDTKKPKGKRGRRARKVPVTEFRCKFCGKASAIQEWADKLDACPKCGLMHVEDDGLGVGWGNEGDATPKPVCAMCGGTRLVERAGLSDHADIPCPDCAGKEGK